MSRLGGAGAVAPLVTDIPLSSVEVINMQPLIYIYISHIFLSQRIFIELPLLHTHTRMKAATVEGTNRHGRNGQTMAPSNKQPSSWKKTQELPCNCFNPKLFALCQSHQPPRSTTRNHRIPLLLSSPKQIPLHNPNNQKIRVCIPQSPSYTSNTMRKKKVKRSFQSLLVSKLSKLIL